MVRQHIRNPVAKSSKDTLDEISKDIKNIVLLVESRIKLIEFAINSNLWGEA